MAQAISPGYATRDIVDIMKVPRILRAARNALIWLAAANALVSAALASPPPRDFYDVDFEPVAGNVYVAIRPESTRQPVMGNGTVIVGDDHVVVVDGNGSPLLADRVIEHIRAITDLPVRYLVVSHWHGDHNLGNHRYLAAFPGIEIVGHRFTRQAMLGATMDYVKQSRTAIPERLGILSKQLKAGETRDGEPLTDWQRRQIEDLLAYSDVLVAETRASEITPPTLTFEKVLVLRGGGPTIEIRHLGRGNTAGDAVVWLPEQRILVTGDVVVHPTPYGFYSYPRSWAAVLQELQALQPRLVIPGHGPVMRDTAYLSKLQHLLEDVADQAERAVASGRSLEEFRKGFDLERHRAAFTGNDAWLDSRFDAWFAQPIAEAAYNEAAGIESEKLEREPPP
ncbi:MAG: MBL fold metallo-hydrolase [Lysobacterales bacterium]